jgi:hypothetical protein
MSATRRENLEKLFRFAVKELIKYEEGKKWVEGLCAGSDQVISELIQTLGLGNYLTPEDVKIAAMACKPMIVLAVQEDNLERAIDGWKAALPLAEAYLEMYRIYPELAEGGKCVPPYTCGVPG